MSALTTSALAAQRRSPVEDAMPRGGRGSVGIGALLRGLPSHTPPPRVVEHQQRRRTPRKRSTLRSGGAQSAHLSTRPSRSGDPIAAAREPRASVSGTAVGPKAAACDTHSTSVTARRAMVVAAIFPPLAYTVEEGCTCNHRRADEGMEVVARTHSRHTLT